MAAEKVTALVLRAVDFSETSCVVTLFTRELGKVSGLAKGGRRLKGPFESSLDLLSLCRVLLLHKSTDALDLLTEARLERRFRPPAGNLAALYVGYYVAELLIGLTDEDDPCPELFDAACDTLGRLAQGESPTALALRFELAALDWTGHLPSLEVCGECGAEVPLTGRAAFALLDGGLLCRDCRSGKRQVVSVAAGTLQVLARFADRHGSAWQRLAVERRVWGEIRGLMNHYLAHLVGREFRMHRYLPAPGAGGKQSRE